MGHAGACWGMGHGGAWWGMGHGGVGHGGAWGMVGRGAWGMVGRGAWWGMGHGGHGASVTLNLVHLRSTSLSTLEVPELHSDDELAAHMSQERISDTQ